MQGNALTFACTRSTTAAHGEFKRFMGSSPAALTFDTNSSMMMSSNMNAPNIEVFDRLGRDPGICGVDCRVASLLFRRSDDGLTSCPSYGTIGRELGCSVRTVRRSVDRLYAFGWFY